MEGKSSVVKWSFLLGCLLVKSAKSVNVSSMIHDAPIEARFLDFSFSYLIGSFPDDETIKKKAPKHTVRISIPTKTVL